MHITFDTLEMVRRLEAKGFKREQAEEIISVVKDVQNELATKTDIENLKKEVKTDIESLRKEVKTDIENLRMETRIDINSLRKDLNHEVEALRKEIKNSELRLVIKSGTLMFSLLLLFKVFDKFL